jgi:hypothetical protein
MSGHMFPARGRRRPVPATHTLLATWRGSLNFARTPAGRWPTNHAPHVSARSCPVTSPYDQSRARFGRVKALLPQRLVRSHTTIVLPCWLYTWAMRYPFAAR